MRKSILSLVSVVAIASAALAGTETYSGKEMKQVAVPPPCPEWYADQEFNVSLWGTYVFTQNDWPTDRYMLSDHAWGGGIDAKYFFHRYFGVGIEGWMVDARQSKERIEQDFSEGIFLRDFDHTHKGIGAVLGTLTFRYPIPCTRFAPYLFGGAGAIFGGGQRPENRFFRENADGNIAFGPGGFISNGGEGFDIRATVGHSASQTEFIGQVGGGMEVRLTPHIGWMSDFSWNFINGPLNNFGMVRSGINFAF